MFVSQDHCDVTMVCILSNNQKPLLLSTQKGVLAMALWLSTVTWQMLHFQVFNLLFGTTKFHVVTLIKREVDNYQGIMICIYRKPRQFPLISENL